MHIDWSSVGAIVGIISLVVVVAGLAGGALLVSRSAANVANYREAAQSWKERAEVREQENDDLRKEVIELRARVAVLQDMVTGKAAVEQLLPKIDAMREELLRAIGSMR